MDSVVEILLILVSTIFVTNFVLSRFLGIFLPLITTNCAVLGVALLIIQKEMDIFQMLFFAVGASIGFTLALLLMAGIREQIVHARIPKVLQGTPISLVTAGLMSLAFLGFAGLVKM